MDRDPAARSAWEVIVCYPGVHALAGHRASHWLWRHRARLPARALAELTRALTGVDIHPGAAIRPGVFIDHATGASARSGAGDAMLPDLVGASLQSLLTRVARLEAMTDGQGARHVIRPPEAGVWHGEDFSI